MQVVGKIRMTLTPLINHWWNTTLYLTPRGLTTSAIPHRDGAFEMRFDFVDHTLTIESSWQEALSIELRSWSSAEFYSMLLSKLREIGVEVKIWPVTVEMPEAIPLDRDQSHASYDREAVNRWWRATLSSANVMTEFRAKFIGKSSPVHFFWGAFDLAVTRFNGRRVAQKREGPLAAVMNEGYSHEVISVGFWPGSGTVKDAAYYAYATPQPEGFADARVRPDAAFYDKGLGEFLLMYDDVRRSPNPRQTLLDFLDSTYAAAADLGHWNRRELEREVR